MNKIFFSDSLFEAIVAYYENNISQEQADELLVWLEGSNENLVYFQEIGKIWLASGMIKKCKKDTRKAWKDLVHRIEDNAKRPMPKPIVKIRVATIYKIAASVLFLVVLGAVSMIALKNRNQIYSKESFKAVSPRGSRSVITLSDGSIVWLNSGTTLEYSADFGKFSRNVILDGEAFFSIAENKEIPFKVRTSEILITALGTSFNVKAYLDEAIIETTLETGEIRIDNIVTDRQIPTDRPVFLKPGQKAVFIKTNDNFNAVDQNQESPVKKNIETARIKPVQIIIDSLVDTKLTTSWKDSRWIFRSERLCNLVPILERRYDVKFIFMDSVLVDYKFTGTLKEESLKQVLNALTLTAPIMKFEILDKNIFLYENRELRSRYKRQIQRKNK